MKGNTSQSEIVGHDESTLDFFKKEDRGSEERDDRSTSRDLAFTSERAYTYIHCLPRWLRRIGISHFLYV